MTNVVVAGIGQTKVGEHWDKSLRELAYYALEAAQKDAGGLRPQSLIIGNMMAPRVSEQAHLGALIADFAGYAGIEATTVEAAGASGGAALRMGYLAIKSRMVDVVMVLGVEKITDKVGPEVDAAISAITDSDYEAVQGMTVAAQAGMLMRRYIYEFDVSRESFGGFPINAHANGVGNEHAMFRKAIKAALYQKAGSAVEPMNMFDIAPDADGAAAVLLSRPEVLPRHDRSPLIKVIGSSVKTDTLSLHDRKDLLVFQAAKNSIISACTQAGISIDEVDLFELYDLYSIFAALSIEAAGLAERGQGTMYAQDGSIKLDGRLPISTMGGLKARGNPWGAVGVYQAVEAVQQLRGEAGINQIKGVRNALIQCLGGPASTAATHVLTNS